MNYTICVEYVLNVLKEVHTFVVNRSVWVLVASRDKWCSLQVSYVGFIPGSQYGGDNFRPLQKALQRAWKE